MAIRRYLRKIKHLSPHEAWVRSRGIVRQLSERRMWKQNQRQAETCQVPDSVIDFEMLTCFLSGCTTEHFEVAKRQSVEVNATAILSGRWKVLGHDFDLAGDIDWHKDPRTDYRWKRKFYGDLPLYDLSDGVDVKYNWELGRQQYVAELARGWLLTHDERFAQRSREIILSWIDSNPLYEGVHWTSGLEVAMRSISWIWTLATLPEWNGWLEGDLAKVGESLAEHATYLEHHFSFYSSPYNHLVGEATALYLISLTLNKHPSSSRWGQVSRKVLSEHGPKQFYDDGFCVEQATGYHFYTLGFLSMAIIAARNGGEPLSELEPAVHRAFQAAIAFRRPDGRWPAIGDIDSARSIPVHHDDFWKFDSLCAVGAVLFDDHQLKIEASGPGEELYWLLGSQGVEAWRRLEGEKASHTRTVLHDSGYAIASDGNDWMLFDAGPIAAGLHADATPSVAHGHADTLQVLYYTGGKSLLHDSGMPFYGGDRQWVDYFRSPAAHNTIEIEGVDVARLAGKLAWSHVAQRPKLTAEFSKKIWLANGRMEWKGVVLHRHVLCLPGEGLWIADYIETDKPREVTWYWQLPAADSQTAGSDSADSCLFEIGESRFSVRSSAAQLQTEFRSPNSSDPKAWRCQDYGVKEVSQQLTARQQVRNRSLVLSSFGRTAFTVRVETGGMSTQDESFTDAFAHNRQTLEGMTWTVSAANAAYTKTNISSPIESETA